MIHCRQCGRRTESEAQVKNYLPRYIYKIITKLTNSVHSTLLFLVAVELQVNPHQLNSLHVNQFDRASNAANAFRVEYQIPAAGISDIDRSTSYPAD
jgi:hypothetical protein